MTNALNIVQGRFGRVALLDMTQGLVTHAHPHCHVLIKVSGADSMFRISGQDHHLTDDHILLVNAWEAHAYRHRPSSEGTMILALYIEPEWLRSQESDFAGSGCPGFFPHAAVPLTPPVRTAVRRLTDSLQEPALAADIRPALDELMVSIIERYSRWQAYRSTYRRPSVDPTDFRIRKATAYMRKNLGNAFTLDDVARESGLSRSHMFGLFHDNLKLSPNLYYNALRVEASTSELAAKKAPVVDLSRRLGFAAPSHFTRFCRTNLGVTPSQYRRTVNTQSPSGQACQRAG